ncbi:MAG: hypothetical protein AVDCRST_MAG91-1005 [uncultured Sphingomonadaceae bacterium]|uniref:MPN domain-containing protein n=1 Tax=uncultured Sphingomonadaceae bacterium TaxID=169976 RepID=A0A6J4SP52_9SPHN|nr:MAG: hypothetical protein AVDCRST_MAG91-1005 [uncultured Sphingomonadaceae bacterium]
MLAAWPGAAGHLAAVRAALLHCLEVGLESRPVLADYAAVVAYLRVLLAHSPREQIAMLFLDARNQLLAAEVGAPGTIDHAPFYPREILRRALELGAAGVIVGHNHPSGDLDPSAADRVVTAELAAGARALGMVVHDHLILARSGWRSMRAMGLVDP